ncbi:1-phosphofructokinase [Agathobaculum sp.]|uniref:1-phosphofructokinase n=1 Tax=Agathobaculum sp. TaxID=2048138 RepID=UPI002A81A965|nr:1-phosphofructokinase [Agathobaculum sp.]MDY3618357.1 1-phosphofructokinase [Agathobaculum sp.]
MIFTVTLNPSLDYIVRTHRLTPGALCRTQNEALYPGGKGVNVSLMLARLGLPSRATGFLAGDTGALFEKLLHSSMIEQDFVQLPAGRTRINVKVRADGETELNGAGPAVGEAALGSLGERLDALQPGDWLVLSGSVPPGLPVNIYARLIARAAKKGAKTVVDTSGDALTHALSGSPALVKPNLDELGAAVGRPLRTPEEAATASAALQRAGAKAVLVSMGGAGALLLPEDGGALLAAAPAGQARNTVGAGDAMVAAYLTAAAHGLSTADTLRYAVAAGSAAAFCDWLPERDAVETLFAQIDSPRPVCYNK